MGKGFLAAIEDKAAVSMASYEDFYERLRRNEHHVRPKWTAEESDCDDDV
jgi:hypothetical protein